jgi:hypothetical protein
MLTFRPSISAVILSFYPFYAGICNCDGLNFVQMTT